MLNFTTTSRRIVDIARQWLPELNFITLHYMYFIFTCLISAAIFWGVSTPARSIGFTDCLYFTVSAMSEAGLNTINLSQLNTFQQFMLFALIMMGSSIFVSASVVYIRRKAFEQRLLTEIEKEEKIGYIIYRTLTRTLATDEKVLNTKLTRRPATLPRRSQDHGSAHSPRARSNDGEPRAASDDEIHRETGDPETPRRASGSSRREQRVSFSEDTRFGDRQRSRDMYSSGRFFDISGVGARHWRRASIVHSQPSSVRVASLPSRRGGS
jgi:hypothetical protein